MPTAGESGTLQYRRSMRKSPVKGNIIAKSGSVYGSYNMAGYGLDAQGKPQTLFVQFVADYYPNKKRDSQPTVAPITQFETQFYQQIVEFSQAIPKK
jgi:D-alanyl-D-alanine carboxypeptidase/D-alanyl-D-alanine-endopeptidase (penicillin-binding protein 4)